MQLKKVWAVGVCLFVCTAWAANSPIENATTFSDPGIVGSRLLDMKPIFPNVGPRVSAPVVTQGPTHTSKLRFKLNKVKILGNTVYSDAELTALFAGSLGHEISVSDLEELVHSITAKYRDAGYILSRAILPPQTIQNGNVVIQVIEGYIGDVFVQNAGVDKALFEGYGKHVMVSRPLQLRVLERYSLIGNDVPGVTVQSVLTPSKTKSGASDLTYVLGRKRATAFISYDNFGTRFLGPLETSVGSSLYSMMVPGDITSVRVTNSSKTQEMRYAELTHAQPLGTSGMIWQVGSNYAETRPEFVLMPLNIVGRNFLLFTDVSYPWIRDRSKNVVVHSTFNYQNVTSTILGDPFYQDRIRSLVLGISFNNYDKWYGSNTLAVDAVHGFPFFGAKDHFYMSREFAKTPYTRFIGTASRLQAIGSRFSLLVALHAQYACDSLLATEQFGIGGSDYGRGYDPSEIIGDKGLAGKVEFRIDSTPGFRWLGAIQYYAFYDTGVIWNINTVGVIPKQSINSTGIGARVSFLPQVTGNVFIGKPLTKSVSVLADMNHNKTAARIFFQLSASV